MIGIFDSGFGGLTILKELVKTLPEYSYIYLGDNDRAPYGSLAEEEIYLNTVEGVRFLFGQGAEIIILACNTSSAVALRRIQQQFLPENFPDKKVLGIIIPTAEEADSFAKKAIGILGTEATIRSKAYQKEILKINPRIRVIAQACPDLVEAIESGNHLKPDFGKLIKKYKDELLKKNADIEAVILGCTHYGLIENQFRNAFPADIRIIAQGKLVAQKLKNYLAKHPEMKLSRKAGRCFYTTGKSKEIEAIAKGFSDNAINFKEVKL